MQWELKLQQGRKIQVRLAPRNNVKIKLLEQVGTRYHVKSSAMFTFLEYSQLPNKKVMFNGNTIVSFATTSKGVIIIKNVLKDGEWLPKGQVFVTRIELAAIKELDIKARPIALDTIDNISESNTS